MKKVKISQIFECNKVLFKLFEQGNKFPISLGFRLYKMMKRFEEVEEYVFELMDMAFENYDWGNMTDEQKKFYSNVMSQEIEIEFEKIPSEFFEKSNDLMLTLDEMEKISLILC